MIFIYDYNFVSLLDEETNKTRDDLKLPIGKLANDVKEYYKQERSIKLIILKSMNQEIIWSFRLLNDE